MNYREQIYKAALSNIEKIYFHSQYSEHVDLYRIYDVINSTNEAQIKSKEWLTQELALVLKTDYASSYLKNILVMGSWYGVLGILLREHISDDVKIYNVDSDPVCAKIKLDTHKNTRYITDNALEYYKERKNDFQLIINTSCEHMDQDDINEIIETKPYDTLFCFQSNNFHKEPEHINTHNSLDEFVESLNTKSILFKDELNPSEEYTRYMVIGI